MMPRKGQNEFEAIGIPLTPPEDFSLERNSTQVLQYWDELRTFAYQEDKESAPSSIKKKKMDWSLFGFFTDLYNRDCCSSCSGSGVLSSSMGWAIKIAS